MTEVFVDRLHTTGPAMTLNVAPVMAWLTEQGLEFNHDYNIGWDWDNDANLLPIINFEDRVDPQLITAFALRWG